MAGLKIWSQFISVFPLDNVGLYQIGVYLYKSWSLSDLYSGKLPLKGISLGYRSDWCSIPIAGALDADRISEDNLSELFDGLKVEVSEIIEKQEEVVSVIKVC